MSGIRKFSRHKAVRIAQKKTTTKMSLWDMLMIIGATLLVIGILGAILFYTTYTAGRSEQIFDGPTGRRYLPEEAPGDSVDKLLAYLSLATLSIGGLLLLISVPGYLITGRLSRDDDSATVSP